VTVALRPYLPTNLGSVPSRSGPLLLLTVLTLPALVWMVALLYKGFSAASGLSRARGALVFTAALIAAEIVSKLVLAWAA